MAYNDYEVITYKFYDPLKTAGYKTALLKIKLLL